MSTMIDYSIDLMTRNEVYRFMVDHKMDPADLDEKGMDKIMDILVEIHDIMKDLKTDAERIDFLMEGILLGCIAAFCL